MARTLMYLGFAIGVLVWLWTSFLAWVNWGLLPALLAVLFPPADLVFMFMLGTWPFGLLATAVFGIGAVLGRGNES